MNYLQLIAAIKADGKRSNYSDADIKRYIAEGEALIRSKLLFYSLIVTLTDADRADATSPVYTLPARVTKIRYVFRSDGKTLDEVDETVAASFRASSIVSIYAKRPAHLVIAGTPGSGAELELHYLGFPAPLVADADTNTLLTDYPQLYKNASLVSLWDRAENWTAKAEALQDVKSLIADLNSQMKLLLGAARSSDAYNTTWRSSY